MQALSLPTQPRAARSAPPPRGLVLTFFRFPCRVFCDVVIPGSTCCLHLVRPTIWHLTAVAANVEIMFVPPVTSEQTEWVGLAAATS